MSKGDIGENEKGTGENVAKAAGDGARVSAAQPVLSLKEWYPRSLTAKSSGNSDSDETDEDDERFYEAVRVYLDPDVKSASCPGTAAEDVLPDDSPASASGSAGSRVMQTLKAVYGSTVFSLERAITNAL